MSRALLCLFLVAGCRSAPLPAAESIAAPEPDDLPDLAHAGCANSDFECPDLLRPPPPPPPLLGDCSDLGLSCVDFAGRVFDLGPARVDLAQPWCGGTSCQVLQYCFVTLPGVPGGSPTYECRNNPADCFDLPAHCGCLATAEQGCTAMGGAASCEEEAHVTLTCAYP